MTPDELVSLLSNPPPGQPDRTSLCPDEHELAAYVDGNLISERREPLELHLADCDACIALVGVLTHARHLDVAAEDTRTAVALALNLVERKSSRWSRSKPGLAAAAMVLLGISGVMLSSRFGDPGTDPNEQLGTRTTRGMQVDDARLIVLEPTAGMALDARQATFRWEAVPESYYYEVRVVTESGDVVIEERVVEPRWSSTTDHPSLRPGVAYYLHVAAYISEGKALSSDHIPFTVGIEGE
jgi:hypothetical protein